MPLLKLAGAKKGELAASSSWPRSPASAAIDSGAYAATKAAVIAITKVMAVECAASEVLVDAVERLRTVDTPMVRPHLNPSGNTRYRTSSTSRSAASPSPRT